MEHVYLRFMVFEYESYYPGGGLTDCEHSSDNLEEAIAHAKKSRADHAEVFDRVEGKCLWRNP